MYDARATAKLFLDNNLDLEAALANLLQEAFDEGREVGEDEGYEAGYDDGYDMGLADAEGDK